MSVGRHQLSSVPWWKRVPSLDDVKYEPIQWLIEPLIPLAGFVLLVGKPAGPTSPGWHSTSRVQLPLALHLPT